MPWNKGKKITQMHGSKHFAWKALNVGYRALHSWIQRELGTPNKCSYCPKKGKGHNMHWANISGEYRRDKSDWIRLCPSCHGIFDSTRRGISNIRNGL